MIRALLILCMSVTPAMAAERMSPEAFRAFSEGRTLEFTSGGLFYGAEQYGPEGRSLWRFADGACQTGRWRARDQDICFTYDEAPEIELCWGFFADNGGHYAQRVDGVGPIPGAAKLWVSRITDRPLACTAPDLGV